MGDPSVQQLGSADNTNPLPLEQKSKSKSLSHNIVIKTSKNDQDFKVKKVETSFDKFLSKITFSKPKYATSKEADTILKNYAQGLIPKDKKVVDVACRVVLASLHEAQDGHKIGLNDLKMYSPDLREKILKMSEGNSHVTHLVSASEMLLHIEKQIAQPDMSAIKEMKDQLMQQKPSIPLLKEVTEKLKDLQKAHNSESLKPIIYEMEYEIFKAELQALNPEKEELQDGHKIGLNDFLACPRDVQEKISDMKSENTYAAHVFAATEILAQAKEKVDQPNADLSIIHDIKNKLTNDNPPAALLKELQANLRELQKIHPESIGLKNIIHEMDYQIFKAQIQELEPGSKEFKQVFHDMPKDQLKEFFPKFAKEVFLKNKQYKGVDGEDFYANLVKNRSGNLVMGPIERSDKDYKIFQESANVITELFNMEPFFKNDLVFTVNAMKTLTSNINAKEDSPFANAPCEAGSMYSLENKLLNVDMKQDQHFEFIVNYSSLPNHMAPVHVRIKDEKMTIIVTEGLETNTQLLDEFKRILRKMPFDNDTSILMCFTDRQKDGTNCPTLSLADAKEFATHPELFDEIENICESKKIEESWGTPHIKRFNPDELPVRLMRFNQSVSTLKKKLESVTKELDGLKKTGGDQERITKLESDKRILEQTIEKHVRKGVTVEKKGQEDESIDDDTEIAQKNVPVEKKEKDFNVFAMQRYRKHEVLVLCALLEQSLKAATTTTPNT